jgi:hypothetical protein
MGIDGITAAMEGITTAIESANRHAQKSTESAAAGDAGGLVAGIVGLQADGLQFQASVAVVKTVDRMQKSLLDILA